MGSVCQWCAYLSHQSSARRGRTGKESAGIITQLVLNGTRRARSATATRSPSIGRASFHLYSIEVGARKGLDLMELR